MKTGISMLLWGPTVTERQFELFERIARWGFDGVEIPVNELDPAHYARIGRALDDVGLARVAAGYATREACAASADAAIRRNALDRIARQVERANALGAASVGGPIHSAHARFSGAPPTDAELGRSAETLHAAAESAARSGVRLGVESLNRFECYLVTTAAAADALVRRADHPNLCTVFDTHHAHIEERSQADAIRACAATLGHVQLSESHRGVPGSGQVDWAGAFGALRAIGYDGWLVIESFSRADPAFANALHVWRDVADSLEQVCVEGLAFIERGWADAAP